MTVKEIAQRECKVRQKQDLTNLLAVILENSTIIPFRWCRNRYRCFYCATYFDQSSNLRQHARREHWDVKVSGSGDLVKCRTKLDGSDISCKLCAKKFTTHHEFLDHASSAHELKFNKDVSQHLSIYALSDDELTCHECGEKIKFFGTLLFHMRKNHSKTQAFLCQMCGESFTSKAYLGKHIRNYHSSLVVNCAICDKEFGNPYLLKKHVDLEHRHSFKCPECPEVLSSKYFKQRHMAEVHDYKMLKVSCDQCPLVFFSNSNLVKHKMHVHPTERSFVCATCGKTFTSKMMLKLHSVVHDNERAFQCEHCSRGFRRKKNLVSHMRIHVNDRRYACHLCSKAYTQEKSLQSHLFANHSVLSRSTHNH